MFVCIVAIWLNPHCLGSVESGAHRAMSFSPNEIFYGGYNAAVWYSGYDENWILGRTAPTNCSGKNSSNKQQGNEEKAVKGVIELKMPICCDGCVKKVNKKLKFMEGVASVECNIEKQKVTVRGEAKPEAVLADARKISPRTEFWKDKK